MRTHMKLFQTYRNAAKRLFEKEGTVEFDDTPLVSVVSGSGAYVQAWIWIESDSITKEDRP